jgi:hypothetical protein
MSAIGGKVDMAIAAPLVGVHKKQAHNFAAAFFCVGLAGSLK